MKPNPHRGHAMIPQAWKSRREPAARAAKPCRMLRMPFSPLLIAAAAASLQLHSPDIGGGARVPSALMAERCGGQGRSPALSWSAAPAGTRSFAIIVHDADAPVPGGFYHWVVYNLPAQTGSLAAGVTLAADQAGLTTRGTPGFAGFCPPPGPAHHYVVTLYALDLEHLASDPPLAGPQVEARVAGHVLARATLEGTAAR